MVNREKYISDSSIQYRTRTYRHIIWSSHKKSIYRGYVRQKRWMRYVDFGVYDEHRIDICCIDRSIHSEGEIGRSYLLIVKDIVTSYVVISISSRQIYV